MIQTWLYKLGGLQEKSELGAILGESWSLGLRMQRFFHALQLQESAPGTVRGSRIQQVGMVQAHFTIVLCYTVG